MKKQFPCFLHQQCIVARCLAGLLLPLILLSASAQEKFTGKVSGSNGVPLAGATISIKGGQTSVNAGEDGTFSISAKIGETLEISFVGYVNREVKLVEHVMLNILLTALAIDLDEVLVTGYTSQRVKEITGSVASVKTKDLLAVPAGQVEQMLQGRVAGMNVITSGEPGSNSIIRIHGIGNFGDMTPLYIIDGVQGNINNLNPNDIESLQVLKDAGAYAIYGVRGANGVIVITTRKGKVGKTRVRYDFYIGSTRPLESPEKLNPQEVADLIWQAKRNSGQLVNGNPSHPLYGNGEKPVLPDYFIADNGKGYFEGDPEVDPNLYNIDFSAGDIYQIVKANKTGTDWFHELYEPALKQEHSLSLSGANDKNKYLFSLGYLDQQGTALNNYFKRFTARVNTEFTPLPNIRIGENLQFAYRNTLGFITDQFARSELSQAIVTQPILPVYDINGGWAHLIPHDFDENLVARRTIGKDNQSYNWELFGNVYASLDFLKYFTIHTSFGGNLTNYYQTQFYYYSYDSLESGLPSNSFSESSGYRTSYTWTNTLKYTREISDRHAFNVLVGIEAINNVNRNLYGGSQGFITNDVNYRVLSNGDPNYRIVSSNAAESSLFSYIGQMDYGYREKYFIKGTLRRDGSSVFGPLNRYGWFPSISMAWRLTEENWFKDWTWLNEFKLRASWGKTGFYGNTDPANQYTLYGGSSADAYYDINGTDNSPVQGFRAVRLGAPQTGWQEDEVANIGFESVFWNGKLSVTADVYKKTARGLLLQTVLPDVLGGAIAPSTNVGEIQNTGFDLLIGSKHSISRSISMDISLMLTSYRNEIMKLGNVSYFVPTVDLYPPYYDLNLVRNEVGHPASSFFGYRIIGFFQDEADVGRSPKQDAAAKGRFKYADVNGRDSTGKLTGLPDGKISEDDRVHFGHPNPDFTMGLNIGFSVKQFDFTAFFYGSFGNEVINATRYVTDRSGGSSPATSRTALYDAWSPQHRDARAPIPETESNFSNWGTLHDYAMEDGSYFRSKSLILGYSFPTPWLKKIKLEKLRVYVQAVNLFTITSYTGLDPEIAGQPAAFGIDLGNYPNNQRQFIVGLNVNF